jgi:NAD(P)H dehydrogenase (quinone)
MKVVIVFNHPYEKSYCNAILKSTQKGLLQAGHEVDLIHLDRDGFNPAMTAADLQAFVQHRAVDPLVIEYQKRIKDADHLIFIFPIWWDIMPACTKGFIDRVLSPGFAYDHHPKGYGLVPLLNHLKGITIITTMNKPGIMYSLLIGNLIKKVMIKSAFGAMGYKKVDWISFTSVKRVSQEKRVKWLNNLETKYSNWK